MIKFYWKCADCILAHNKSSNNNNNNSNNKKQSILLMILRWNAGYSICWRTQNAVDDDEMQSKANKWTNEKHCNQIEEKKEAITLISEPLNMRKEWKWIKEMEKKGEQKKNSLTKMIVIQITRYYDWYSIAKDNTKRDPFPSWAVYIFIQVIRCMMRGKRGEFFLPLALIAVLDIKFFITMSSRHQRHHHFIFDLDPSFKQMSVQNNI